MKKPEIHDLALGTGAAIIILLITVLIGEIIGTFPWWKVGISVLIGIVIILGIVAIVLALVQTKHDDELQSIISRLTPLVPPSTYSWLKSQVELIQVEGNVSAKDIWIISPDLSNDTNQAAEIQKAVKRNLKKGITYTYMLPETEEINALLPALRLLFSSYPNQLIVIKIPFEVFQTLTIKHIAIFNPNMEGDRAPNVFIEAPVKDEGYWIEVIPKVAIKITGRFRMIIESASGNNATLHLKAANTPEDRSVATSKLLQNQ